MPGRYKDPEYQKKHYEANKEKYKAKAKEWKKNNPDKVKTNSARRYAKNKESMLRVNKEYYSKLPPEVKKARSRAWREANPEKARANVNTRRRRNRQATPPWVDTKEIMAFYEMSERVSKCLGIPHHVDHIIPLAGKGFSGLNVPWNLRVVPAIVNLRKNNKLIEELL